MAKPRISIVIPSYNKAQFIGKTLDSIFGQNYSNLEVIIQDGGSTDGTLDIIKSFSKKYPIIWESKKDKGQLDAVNKGLAKATGNILTFINADDVYEDGAFSEVTKSYQDNPQALWFAEQGKVIDKNGKEIAKPSTWYKNFLLSLNSRFYLLTTNYLTQPSVFFTKEAYTKYGPFEGTGSGVIMEYGFWLKLSKISMPVVIGKVLSSFRITDTNISSVAYKSILKEDELITKKFTKNKFILFLHKLNNLGRVFIIKIINR